MVELHFGKLNVRHPMRGYVFSGGFLRFSKRYSKCGYSRSFEHLKSLHSFVLAGFEQQFETTLSIAPNRLAPFQNTGK